MLPSRIRISKRATDHLKTLKARTKLTPNVLSRIALAVSLRKGARSVREVKLDGSEFNLPTLFGDQALLYECLLRQMHGQLNPKKAQMLIAWHIEQGVEELRKVKNAADLLAL
jgi:DNA sulfur modification protein DndE